MSIMTADVKNSTLTLNGRVVEDTPEGDVFTVAWGNDITKQTQGTSGGKVIKETNNKDDGLLTVRLLKYSADDAFFQNQINSANGPVVFDGSLKTNFTRDGVDGTETVDISSGSLASRGDLTVNNTDGEDLVEYIILSTAVRSL